MEYKSENRKCQNCETDFVIEPDDFNFYQKIKVPPPTFCPECRYIRRLLDRNEWNLYKRKCDATGEDVISIYQPDAPFPVYNQEYWKSDSWDSLSYGQDFDFHRSFFEQYQDLRLRVPHLALVNSGSVNSPYTNQSGYNRDCYMCSATGYSEKCMYGNWYKNCHFSGDCYMALKSEFCYECINITRCSKCLWCQDCSDSVSLQFCIDCRGCTDCFGCVGLREKRHYWLNTALTKEEYEKRMKKFVWDRDSIKKSIRELIRFRANIPAKYYHGSQIQDSTGDYMENSKRARYVFNCRDNKDTAYMQDVWTGEDCLDCTEVADGQLSYEIQGCASPHRSIVVRSSFVAVDSYYCDMCFSVRECFGCFGLKQKEFCILNKQYSKEEYFKLKEKIIEHMRKMKEWGEYFPADLSPFTYNESIAQDYFPLTREDALKAGYAWYDRPVRDYKITLPTDDLPKTLSDVKENIFEDVIQCSSQKSSDQKYKYPLCSVAFKITPLEFSLYKILNIPVPEKCFACRRTDRFVFRNPRKLWHRQCMCGQESHGHAGKCQNEFETSYAPDRSEIIYCERCYQQEVY